MLEADLVLHVRDISHPQSDEQAEDVEAILQELGVAEDTPMIEVWNKMDLVTGDRRETLMALAERNDAVFPVSAWTGSGLHRLFDSVSVALEEEKTERELHLDFADGRRRAWLHEEGVIEAETQSEDGFDLKVRWTARQEKRFRDL